jgi:hypothetical protein
METASIIRRIRPKPEPLARCKRGTAKSFKKRPAGTHRNGFLTHSFNPFWGVSFNKWQEKETGILRSLHLLCDFYGWAVPEVTGLSFPENILTALKVLNAKNTDSTTCMLLQDKEHPPVLATIKSYNTEYRLYYIPVRPLVKMRAFPEMEAQYTLIRGLFSYLYSIVGVPYFREGGYMDNTYDALEDWIKEIDGNGDADDDFTKRQLKEFKAMKKGADALFPEIKTSLSLAELAKILKQFTVKDSYDAKLLEVATELYKLYDDYPKRKISDRMHYELQDTGESDQIYWEQYISFYWSGEDCLQENLFEMVNNEFQEMGYQEEPVSIRFFDRPQESTGHEFDFEARFFALTNRLTELLNDFDDEEPNE